MPFHHFDEVTVHALIGGKLGVKRGRKHVALAYHDAVAVSFGEQSTPGPQRSIQGARMKIAAKGVSPRAGIATSSSAESFWRPNALRRTVMSIKFSVG